MTRSELINYAEELAARNHVTYPLNYCQARIYDCGNNEYLLRSYSTIVAIGKWIDGKIYVYVFDYYSNTTNTTHIPKFREWLRSQYRLSYTDVIQSSLYRPSRMSKKQYELLSSNDWKSVIGNVFDYSSTEKICYSKSDN